MVDLKQIDSEIVKIVADDEINNCDVPETRELEEKEKSCTEAELEPESEEISSGNDISSEETSYTSLQETDTDDIEANDDDDDDDDAAKDSDKEYLDNVDAEELEKAFLDHEISAMIGDGIREAKMNNFVSKNRVTLAEDIKLRNLGKTIGNLKDSSGDSNVINIHLVTKKLGKENKIQAKPIQVSKDSSIYQTMFKKAPVDIEELANLKRFVLESVIRIRKQECFEPQPEKYSMRRQHALPSAHWRQSNSSVNDANCNNSNSNTNSSNTNSGNLPVRTKAFIIAPQQKSNRRK